ncbi:MAG: selenide, water dikinase [Dehalococcoidia bacterium]|nr:MAG: selenide, water dikinase [Dehalococcoidia bacterium]
MLRHLPPLAHPNVLVGTETRDDAAVYQLNDETALVATVDFFTPIVDDPYAFGQIGAANALSDVYAMGGQPLYALAIVAFPRDLLPTGMLAEIARGGIEKAAEAGCPIIGGHSIDDAEPKYGLAVTGIVHPARVVRNVGARPGDALFLTKPLGTGIIATAIKRGIAPPETVEAAIAAMTTLNRGASEAMLRVGPHAATDITGFGLLGHLLEMTSASGVGARLSARALPFLPRVRELAEAGAIPGGTRRNLEAVTGAVRWADAIDEIDRLCIADAQTSGGLLIAVSAEQADALQAALLAAETPAAARIGEIVAGSGIEVFR